MQGLQERFARVPFRGRLEQARGKCLLPLHTCRISLKFHVLLAGLNVSFITSAFQGSQSFGCADIKARKWLKSSKVAIGCLFLLGIKIGTWLHTGLAPEDQQHCCRQCCLHKHPLILPHLPVSMCHLVLHAERVNHGGKKRIMES